MKNLANDFNKPVYSQFLVNELYILLLVSVAGFLQWMNLTYIFWSYALALFLTLGAGVIHTKALSRLAEGAGARTAFGITILFLMVVGIISFVLSLLFDLDPWFFTFQLAFPIPLLIYHAYTFYLKLPAENQRVDPKRKDRTSNAYSNPGYIRLVLCKNPNVPAQTIFTINPRGDVKISEMFISFLNQYNKKSRDVIIDPPKSGGPDRWQFFIKKGWLGQAQLINSGLSFSSFALGSDQVIYAVREGVESIPGSRWVTLFSRPSFWILTFAIVSVGMLGFFWVQKLIKPSSVIIDSSTELTPDTEEPAGKKVAAFTVVQPANEDLLIIQDLTSKLFGYANVKDSSIKLPCTYEEAHPFMQDVALVKKNRMYRYISADGTFAFNGSFEYAEDFKNGVANVGNSGSRYSIDLQGNRIIGGRGPSLYIVVDQAGENLLIVKDRNSLLGYAKSRDTSLVIGCKFEEANPFKSGKALVKQGGKYHWIRSNGSNAFPGEFDDAEDFQNGFAKVRIGSSAYYIDSKGDKQDVPAELCKATCDTKGIIGVEVMFTDNKTGKKYKAISNGQDLEFDVPCYMLQEAVRVTFRKNDKSDFSNYRLKDFEIPEDFKSY